MTISNQNITAEGYKGRSISNPLRSIVQLTVASLVFPCSLAFAETTDNIYPASAPSGGIVGIGIASLPEYQGSDQTEIKGVPVLEYHWSNGFFVGGDNNTLIGLQCLSSTNVQYGTALGIDEGRDENDSNALAGMGNVVTKVVLASFVKAAITDQFSISATVNVGSGNNHKGALVKFGAAYAIPLSSSAQVIFNADSTFANDSYMDSYFGVSAAQAITSRYELYKASSGFRDLSVGMRFHYQIDQDWSLLAGVSSTSLGGSAKDSPLVHSSNTQKAFFGMAYSLR